MSFAFANRLGLRPCAWLVLLFALSLGSTSLGAKPTDVAPARSSDGAAGDAKSSPRSEHDASVRADGVRVSHGGHDTGGAGAGGDAAGGKAEAGDAGEAGAAGTGGTDSGSNGYALNAGLGPAPEGARRETPRNTVRGFLYATSRGDYELASHYLSLRHVPPAQHKALGAVLARQLADVIERTVYFDLDTIPDESDRAQRDAHRGQQDVLVGSVSVPGGKQGLRLTRVRDGQSGDWVWVFSKSTVDSIDTLYELHGLPPLLERLPGWMRGRRLLGLRVWQWVGLALLAGLSWLVGILVERVGTSAIGRAGRDRWKHVGDLRGVLRGPGRMLAALVFLLITSRVLRFSVAASETLERVMYIGIVYAGMRGAVRLVTYAVKVVQEGSLSDIDDDTRQRTMATRVTAVRRIVVVLIVVIGIALVLVQFPNARSAGISLLGSAGVAGAILGFAAQKVFANLFAGIMISLTQPMRIGDVVVVENEWGRVEEIGSTHVVIRVWDLRRLVLPVTYFLEKPFQNWTKQQSEINGTVFLHTDYHVDVDGLRKELDRILTCHPLWDGREKTVVVYDLTDKGAVIRVTVSATDGPRLWDLRCDVREKLLAYLQQSPEQLPKWRVEPRASLSVLA